MEHDPPLEEVQKLLLGSFDDVAKVLKALGHPSRLKVVLLLLPGSKSFQHLLEHTQLKKTALANHLTHLRAQNLITKVQHGMYEISADGRGYLLALGDSFQSSAVAKRRMEEARRQFELSRSFLDRRGG